MIFSELVMLFEINQKIINVFFPGLYFFSIQYNTRTCGALSLCGPTRVDFFKNTEVIRSFSRNLATNRKSDMDMVCAMAIRVVEFSNGGYKIGKIFA